MRGSRAGGRPCRRARPWCRRGWPYYLTRPARLYGQPVLCDLHDSLDRHQEGLLAHPEEAPGAYLQEAHLALTVVYVEILHASYALPFQVVDVLAAEVVSGFWGTKSESLSLTSPIPACVEWVTVQNLLSCSSLGSQKPWR